RWQRMGSTRASSDRLQRDQHSLSSHAVHGPLGIVHGPQFRSPPLNDVGCTSNDGTRHGCFREVAFPIFFWPPRETTLQISLANIAVIMASGNARAETSGLDKFCSHVGRSSWI